MSLTITLVLPVRRSTLNIYSVYTVYAVYKKESHETSLPPTPFEMLRCGVLVFPWAVAFPRVDR